MADAEIDVAAEAMALPAGVRTAAEAIEGSVAFRQRFTPAHPLGHLHPVAVEFARLALAAMAKAAAPGEPSDEDRIRGAMAEAQDRPGRIITR